MFDVHWWLMALAFVLGLALTFALMVRRVKRDVPLGAASAVEAASSAVGTPDTESEPATAQTSTAGDTATTKRPADAPYGVGSARAGDDGSGPSGWLVKGNEDSKLYHTPDNPSYEQVRAEVWFRDEESAAQAGFSPWHQGDGTQQDT